jgi:hypothetical protein
MTKVRTEISTQYLLNIGRSSGLSTAMLHKFLLTVCIACEVGMMSTVSVRRQLLTLHVRSDAKCSQTCLGHIEAWGTCYSAGGQL